MKILEFFGKGMPPYVILSHTWGDDEVTFQDMQNSEAQSKQGFAKIKRCCEEAVKDGIEYVWVDTCCIDKASSSELSEAINSMFQWYRHAVRCYAYLSDMSSQLLGEDIQTRLPLCRWFTRGWTLQELLAPRELIFFAQDWTQLGQRSELATIISAATGIHGGALTGNVQEVRAFSIAQKFSWASKRHTTREEDMAYCLLGLFNVHMPLLYGEGSQAFTRLQEEIMKRSDDQTIFAWYESDIVDLYRGLLAFSPKEFERCTRIVPFRNWGSSRPYENTNAGLRLTASLLEGHDDTRFFLILQCYDQKAPERFLGIELIRLSPDGDQFARIHGLQYRMSNQGHMLPPRTMYIRNDIILPEAHILKETGRLIRFQVSIAGNKNGRRITQAWPPDQWNKRSQMLSPPADWSKGTSDRVDRRPHPGLFNWSWHAMLHLGSQVARATAVSEDNGWNIVIGYNGRDDQCWCSIRPGSSSYLEDMWTITPYSRATSSSALDGDNKDPSVHITLLGPDGGKLPETVTSSWNGKPLMVLIQID